ncbi:MAG: hypothetical protein IJH81_11010 [Lachnospiraceae bacterium]|nr:hypothetical protein [Lachnospiraceae bacterium]
MWKIKAEDRCGKLKMRTGAENQYGEPVQKINIEDRCGKPKLRNNAQSSL